MKPETIAKLIILIVAIGGIVMIGPRGCTQPEKSTRLLEQQGYKDIIITGWRPMMAGQEDTFSTGFEATAPNGRRVTGAVTSGVFKGATVRFD